MQVLAYLSPAVQDLELTPWNTMHPEKANHFGESPVLPHAQGVCHAVKSWTGHT